MWTRAYVCGVPMQTQYESVVLQTTVAPGEEPASFGESSPSAAAAATLAVTPTFLDWARLPLCEPVELSLQVSCIVRPLSWFAQPGLPHP